MPSIVDFLKSKKRDSSYAARSKLAAQYGIENYRGTAAQNIQLLGILRSEADTTVSDKEDTTKKDTSTDQEITTKKDTVSDKGSTDIVSDKDIYSARDEYMSSYIGALGESFDKTTALKIQEFETAREDLDLEMDYYRKDFAKITDRKTQDYYKGIALQNADFSKSLDYVSNVATKTIGALQGFGKNRIVEATSKKMEDEARYKLSFDRSMEDLATQKQRKEARYKLSTTRLAEGKEQYETQRDVEKKVMGIEATGELGTYYDTLITGKTLAEDEAAKRRRNITGGGTGVESILNY